MTAEAGDRGVETRGGAARPSAGAVAAGSYDNPGGVHAIRSGERFDSHTTNMKPFPAKVLVDGSQDPKEHKDHIKEPKDSKDQKEPAKPTEHPGHKGAAGGTTPTQPTEATPPPANPASALTPGAEVTAALGIIHSGAPDATKIGALNDLIGKLGDNVPGAILAMRDRAVADSLKPPRSSA